MGIIKVLSNLFSNTYIDKRGYKRFKDSNEPMHRWAAEKRLGRKLRQGEVVHHKNRDKTDNRAENLWVFKNQIEHDMIHKKDAKRYGTKISYKGFRSKKGKGF